MNKFITTLKNIWSIEELRKRILNTLLIILIFRIGSHIVLPGLDTKILSEAMKSNSNSLLDLLNTLVGGGFQNASIMALGIMPYISASIAIQLLTLALPYFSKLSKEGESGRKKLNQITRWLTILVSAAQAFAYIRTQVIPTGALVVSQPFFMFYSVILLVAGTIMCMWLGERMTEKGIGNGISMMIMIGIVSRFPGAIIGEAQDKGTSGLLIFIIELVLLFLVVLFAVAITQATRRIPVQYAKQIVGNKVVTGQRQYLPLKLNIAGVMPIIFGQALMFIPSFVFNYLGTTMKNDTLIGWGAIFGNPASWQYCLLYAILIIAFTFFYTAISINPNQIADDMKRGGGFIPGIKPGQPTSDFIANVLDKITLPGGILLAAIAILPAIAGVFGMTPQFAQFFGGTSLLILVGVVLDTLQQIESYLLMKRYEGLMKSGRIQGRTSEMATV